MMIGDPAGSVGTAGLLVGDREVHDVTAWSATALGQVLERHRHRRRQVEHVDRAAAPDLLDAIGVGQPFAPERIP